jgi:hypothetical protein
MRHRLLSPCNLTDRVIVFMEGASAAVQASGVTIPKGKRLQLRQNVRNMSAKGPQTQALPGIKVWLLDSRNIVEEPKSRDAVVGRKDHTRATQLALLPALF